MKEVVRNGSIFKGKGKENSNCAEVGFDEEEKGQVVSN